MNQLYFSLPEETRKHVMSLEPFDEYEEWHLKCSHYHMITGFTSPQYWSSIMGPLSSSSNNDDDEGGSGVLEEWRALYLHTESQHLKRYWTLHPLLLFLLPPIITPSYYYYSLLLLPPPIYPPSLLLPPPIITPSIYYCTLGMAMIQLDLKMIEYWFMADLE